MKGSLSDDSAEFVNVGIYLAGCPDWYYASLYSEGTRKS